MKDTNMNDIKIYLCVRNVMTVKPVLNTEREKWGAIIILIKVDYGVYMCTCSVQSEYYHIKTKHLFLNDSYFKKLNQQKCFGDLVHNRLDAIMCVLDYNGT